MQRSGIGQVVCLRFTAAQFHYLDEIINKMGQTKTASLNTAQIFPIITAVCKLGQAVSQHFIVSRHISQRRTKFMVENLQDIFLERLDVTLPRLFALIRHIQLGVNQRQEFRNDKWLGDVKISIT